MISVVIPTYNGAEFISGTLTSVLRQTVLPGEIVVVDDCSTDSTREIVKTIAEQSAVPIRLITLQKNHGGPARPLNVGINASEGEHIALLDQDDHMRPAKIQSQHHALETAPQCSVVIGGIAIMGRAEDDMTPLWPVPQFHELLEYIGDNDFTVVDSAVAFPPLLQRNYSASCSNLFFSRQQWKVVGEFDESIRTCNDLDFMLKAAATGPVGILKEKVFDYRWQSSSLQRRSVLRSTLEATMVRLRASSAHPELAGEELHGLRYTALDLGFACLKHGDLRGFEAIVETFSKHKGIETLRRTFRNKTSRILRTGEQ